MSDPSLLQTFRAACYFDGDKDDVLATAVSRISSDYHIESARADKFHGIVFVTVRFKTPDHDHAVRLAGLTASALSHRWPTDSVTLNGRPVKGHHVRQEA